MGNHALVSYLGFCISIMFGSTSFAGPILLGTGGCSWTQESQGMVTKVTPAGAQCINPMTGEVARTEYVTPNADFQSQKKSAANSTKPQAPKTSTAKCDASMKVGTRCQCPFDISALSFVDEKFNGTNFCVKASNDDEARNACTPYGYRYVNPGNPDYLPSKGAWGTADSNNLNFYYCYKGTTKQEMCRAASVKRPELKFTWSNIGSVLHKDGICKCDKNGDSNLENCNQATVESVAQETSCGKNQKKDSNGTCVCEEGYQWDSGNGQTRICISVQTAKSPGELSEELINCVQSFEKRAADCESSATQAKKTCDQKNAENPEVNDALGATELISEMFQRQNQGTGMVTECVKAGALAKSPKIILNALKEKCDANFDECSKSCSDEEVQKYTQQCGDIANKVAQAEVSTKGTTPNNNKNVIYYQERLAVIKKGQEAGSKMCKEDASSTRSIFADVLSGLGQSFLQAQRCACQAASTALGTTQSTCSSLPTSEQCLANPSLAGCPAVISVDICSPGSQNYSYQGCKCQQDPKAVGCPQYAAANPGLNGFAGTDIGSGSGGNGMSFGAAPSGGGLNPGDLNLNGAAASELASGNKSGGLGAGFNGSPGGGGGSLGGVPGGGPEGGAGAGGEDGDRGSSGGAFGFVKSIAGSLFGGGAGGKKNDASKAGGAASKFDPNKYRPNRGLAQEYGVGNKNSELWQLMHDGYEMNQPTFIPNP